MNDAPAPTKAPTRQPLDLRWIAADGPELAAEHDLRYRVLRAPLGMGRDTVRSPIEHESWHLCAFDGVSADAALVGCVLFHIDEAEGGRLLQMAVDPRLQGLGLGRQLVQTLEARVAATGMTTIHLHARDSAIGFYERLGYEVEGDAYVEVGIPHHDMRKRWAPR